MNEYADKMDLIAENGRLRAALSMATRAGAAYRSAYKSPLTRIDTALCDEMLGKAIRMEVLGEGRS